MKYNRRVKVFILICFIFLSLSGCSLKVKQTNEELTIYIGAYQDILEYAVELYKKEYPDIKVNVIKSNIVDYTDNKSRMDESTSFFSTLMAGDGADVFILDQLWDMDKVLESGMLADLSQFYESDLTLDKKNYNQTLMDKALYNEQRLYIPITYSIPFLLTSESILKNEQFNIENCNNFKSFCDETEAWMERNHTEMKLFKDNFILRPALGWAGFDLLDIENQKVHLDTNEVREYFEWYKKVIEAGEREPIDGTSLLGAALIRDRKILFDNDIYLYTYDRTIHNYKAILTFDKPVLLPIRNNSGGMTATINTAMGVRSNSSNMQNAYNFIKIVLSDKVQQMPKAQQEGVLSMSNKVMDEIVYPVKKAYHNGGEYDGFPMVLPELSKEQHDEYMRYTKEIDQVQFLSHWQGYLFNEMKPFLNNEKTYEECINNAKEKIEIYLSE